MGGSLSGLSLPYFMSSLSRPSQWHLPQLFVPPTPGLERGRQQSTLGSNSRPKLRHRSRRSLRRRSVLVGLMLYAGLSLVTVKLGMILVLLWLTSPVSTYALARAALNAGLEPIRSGEGDS